MFKTAGVRFMRRVVSALSILSFAGLLGACVNSSPPDPGEPKSWVVEDVAGKSTAQLYASTIAPATFDRSSTKVIDGYTVESGNLRMPDRSEGALVTVRSVDGSLTALIQMPGKRGLLRVSNKGLSTFTMAPSLASNFDDRVPGPSERVVTPVADSAKNQTYTVDILLGYSRAAVTAGGGDVNANALAQVEFVNLALRNSLVTNVALKLVGVQVIDEDFLITLDAFHKLPELFSEGFKKFDPDIFFGFFAKQSSGPGGMAAGRMGIGLITDPGIMSHEIGHIAGIAHCNTDQVPQYHFGYNNGKSATIMCDDYPGVPYYSTPMVRDLFGLPLGSAGTADGARVWHENAQRLSSYAHFVPTAPTGFREVWSSYGSIKFEWQPTLRAVKYEIMGRVSLIAPYKKFGESTEANGVANDVPQGLRQWYVVAVYMDGSKSQPSNIVYAKPNEAVVK